MTRWNMPLEENNHPEGGVLWPHAKHSYSNINVVRPKVFYYFAPRQFAFFSKYIVE